MAKRPVLSRTVIILAFVALASGFGQDLISPILPGYLTLLGLSRADIGLIDGLLQGMTNLCRLLSGWLTDRWPKRKELIFIGYILSSIARPWLAWTGTIFPIASLRVLDGAGKGIKDAPRDALIAETTVTNTSGTTFGFHRFVDTAGSVLGPIVAFLCLAWLTPSLASYRLIFALSLIPGAIALALIWFGLQESFKAKPSTQIKSQTLPWPFWVFTIATCLATLTKINDSLFLVRASDLGITKTWIPLLFGGFTLLYALLSYPIGKLSDRIGKLPLLGAGWLLLSVVEYGFSFEPTLAMTLILFASYGLFFALTEGSARAFIADTISKNAHGRAYGVYYATLGISLIVGGYVLGSIWDQNSPELAFRIAALGSCIASIIIFTIKKPTPQPAH